MKDIKTTIISTLKEFEQQDYKRGGVSIAPEMYGAIADKLCSRFTIGNLDLVHEPNECCGRCDGVNDFCINEESTMMELKSLYEPNQTIMNTEELKDNKIMLLEEDLWCVHRYLDDLKIPRVDKDEKEYSIVGRIKRLEERYLKQMSEIETQNLSNNYTEQPFNLETALKHPEWVRTRDGREIDFIKDYPETRGFFSIVSITKCGSFYLVNKNGKVGQLESDFDLILRVPYREVWVNIYPNGNCVWYDTKEEANEYTSNSTTIVACVPVKIPAI